jgi:rhodanese-related sulfurtransferase
MRTLHGALAIVAATLGLGAAAADLRPGVDVASLAAEMGAERDHIAAPDLAQRIMRRDRDLKVFDVRSRAEYEQFHVPGADHATVEELSHLPLPRRATIVLYSEGGTHGAQAWMLLRLRGYRNVFFLREGIYEWIARVHEPRLAVDATPAERLAFERAADQSRFFGGQPLSGVPRAEVPVGYWTSETADLHAAGSAATTRDTIAGIRRRGC